MLIDNIELSFDRQIDDRLVFKTELGVEISIPAKLLRKNIDHDKKIYLASDYQPLKNMTDSQKDTLNELLNKEE